MAEHRAEKIVCSNCRGVGAVPIDAGGPNDELIAVVCVMCTGSGYKMVQIFETKKPLKSAYRVLFGAPDIRIARDKGLTFEEISVSAKEFLGGAMPDESWRG